LPNLGSEVSKRDLAVSLALFGHRFGNARACSTTPLILLADRNGRRVKFDYIGPHKSRKVKKIREQIEQRKKYEERRWESLENLKQVEKLINASRR
jgi:hypothetical protein